MSKRTNTILFMLGATVVNIVLMLVILLGCLALIARFVDLESPLVFLYVILTFLVAIGGSFWAYARIIKWANNKYDLESRLGPIFTRKRKK